LEYDYDAVQQRKIEWRASQTASVSYVPPELNSKRILSRHRALSQLAGVDFEARRPDDVIGAAVFVDLERRIEQTCESAGTYVNKFLAHSAAPENRAAYNADGLEVTLATLKAAHKSFCEVTAFLSLYVLGDAHPNFVPIAQYNLWEHIDRPLVRAEQVEGLRRAWQHCEKEWHEWTSWGMKGYLHEYRA
jgi:hypothetical protein